MTWDMGSRTYDMGHGKQDIGHRTWEAGHMTKEVQNTTHNTQHKRQKNYNHVVLWSKSPIYIHTSEINLIGG